MTEPPSPDVRRIFRPLRNKGVNAPGLCRRPSLLLRRPEGAFRNEPSGRTDARVYLAAPARGPRAARRAAVRSHRPGGAGEVADRQAPDCEPDLRAPRAKRARMPAGPPCISQWRRQATPEVPRIENWNRKSCHLMPVSVLHVQPLGELGACNAHAPCYLVGLSLMLVAASDRSSRDGVVHATAAIPSGLVPV